MSGGTPSASAICGNDSFAHTFITSTSRCDSGSFERAASPAARRSSCSSGEVSRGSSPPASVRIEAARKAAALCAANVLRLVRQELGSLDRVERMLRVTGYVNSDADFTSQHLVINGASQLFVDVFGDQGWHARSAVGMAQLPLGASVEVEAILKLRVD